MTLREFINECGSIKEELLDTEIVVSAPNGILFEPKIKFIIKETGNLNIDKNNVYKIIITYE